MAGGVEAPAQGGPHGGSLTVVADPGTCYLVRHGEAGRREAWQGPDEGRPLTPEGEAQAEALVGLFAAATISRVRSSSFARCVQTVQPIATARGLPVEPVAALREGAPVAAALGLILAPEGAGALLCSHGDVIDGVIGHLTAEGVALHGGLAAPGAGAETPKGATWVFTLAGGRVRAGTLLPPP